METVTEQYDYSSLIKMLDSPDEENIVVALQCIDHMNFKDNIVTILLLYKKANVSMDMWKKHAPLVVKSIKGLNVTDFAFFRDHDNASITYSDIMKIMQKQKVNLAQVEKFIEALNDTIKNDLLQYGFDFIEEINIKVKYKGHEQKS